MIVITGGAGFIGSNLVAALEERGQPDLVVCDRLGRGDKWRNIAKRELAHIVPPEGLLAFLDAHARDVGAVFHMGAISSTTETDADAIVAANFTLSLSLWNWCARHGARFIYASSAATYGAGDGGFDDDGSSEALARLHPLNAYGWSKHLFDRRVARLAERAAARPPQWIGCKFFNVYGPNEYHKEDMRSVVTKFFPLAKAGEPAALFRSYRQDVPDGGQRRDFVYVRDCVDVMLWFLDHPDVNGLFNVGSGKARSFSELVTALYRAAGRAPMSDFVPMPEAIREKYQYFTEAKLDKLRRVGYTRPTTSLEDGVGDFVRTYLAAADPYR
ncbi:MAG TPA: ADP-glyceromanno-heptose 6-epimerase [Stellaceae bacterium]|nr:ADP-glyceromanno-heptose 6-epimerase [Stellaceae bacterium]